MDHRLGTGALNAGDEHKSTPKRQPSMAAMVAGLCLWFVMWAWTIIGTVYVVIGALYFALDPDGHYISIQGDTTREKLVNMAIVGSLGAVGILFLCLRRLGYLRLGDRIP
jgi:hypothetical protein